MNMNTAIFLAGAIFLGSAGINPGYTHDEGHGPKLTDSGKRGGIIAPVIRAKDVKLGSKAELMYKAEMVRSEDGAIKVYLYDQSLNAVDLSSFESKGKGIVEFKKQKKWTHLPFDLVLENDAFSGKAPTPTKKPFNIDIKIKTGHEELLAAFDNLD